MRHPQAGLAQLLRLELDLVTVLSDEFLSAVSPEVASMLHEIGLSHLRHAKRLRPLASRSVKVKSHDLPEPFVGDVPALSAAVNQLKQLCELYRFTREHVDDELRQIIDDHLERSNTELSMLRREIEERIWAPAQGSTSEAADAGLPS
jgi:hypothetical protein